MSYELRKHDKPDIQHRAAAKLQALQRKRIIKKKHAKGGGGRTLHTLYDSFLKTYGQEKMTLTLFVKFCKDSNIINNRFNAKDCEMAWTKACGKEKNISYPDFSNLLDAVAIMKNVSYAELATHILLNNQNET